MVGTENRQCGRIKSRHVRCDQAIQRGYRIRRDVRTTTRRRATLRGTARARGSDLVKRDTFTAYPATWLNQKRWLRRASSFMANEGYPMNGNWCGEFAASVVRSAGGKPPPGAAVASIWLKWGQPVSAAEARPATWPRDYAFAARFCEGFRMPAPPGCLPSRGSGAGVRNPPKKETASRKGAYPRPCVT